VKVFLLGILLCNSKAFAVLPDIAFLAGNAVAAIIEVLAIGTTARAVEDPLIVLRQFCQILLRLLQFSFQVPRRNSAFAALQLLLLCGDSLKLCFM
jgi:hypothetical protein